MKRNVFCSLNWELNLCSCLIPKNCQNFDSLFCNGKENLQVSNGNLQNSYSIDFFFPLSALSFLRSCIIMEWNSVCITSDFGKWAIYVKEMPLQWRKVPVFHCPLAVLRNWPYLHCHRAWKNHVCLLPVKAIVLHYYLGRRWIDTAN